MGNHEGGNGVEAGSLGQDTYASAPATGAILAGLPVVPGRQRLLHGGLADIYGNGQNDIIRAATPAPASAYGQTYSNGGHIRVLSSTGTPCRAIPAGGLVCQYNTDQNIDSRRRRSASSSPAAASASPSATAATTRAPRPDEVFALNTRCGSRGRRSSTASPPTPGAGRRAPATGSSTSSKAPRPARSGC